MAIVGAAANLEHELANGYNSGDEYTGRTGNNLTLAEWQEVGLFNFTLLVKSFRVRYLIVLIFNNVNIWFFLI